MRFYLTRGAAHVKIQTASSPHRLVAQDVALSRPKLGFESPWGHR